MSVPVFDPEVYGEPVYSDALIDPEVYGESPLADEEAAGGTGSFTSDAVLWKAQAGSFTSDASITIVQTFTFTANAVKLKRRRTGFPATLVQSKSATGTTPVGLAFDTTPTAGNLIVLGWVDRNGANQSANVVSGFIDGGDGLKGGYGSARIYYKKATGTESGELYTNVGTKTVAWIAEWSGVDIDNAPQHAWFGHFGSGDRINSTWDFTVTDDSLLVGLHYADNQPWTPITGTTELFDRNVNGIEEPQVAASYRFTIGAGTFSVGETNPGGSNNTAGFFLAFPQAAGETPPLTADAWVGQITVASSLTANATKRKTTSGSFTGNAVKFRTLTGSLAANAVIEIVSYEFTADAAKFKRTSRLWTFDAVIKRLIQPGSFTADARKAKGGSFTADAWKFRTISGSWIINSVIRATRPGSFTANAYRTTDTTQTGSFTANAVKYGTRSGSFTANASTSRSRAGSFPVRAMLRKTASGSYTADATFTTDGHHFGSITANAWIFAPGLSTSFTADANFVPVSDRDPGRGQGADGGNAGGGPSGGQGADRDIFIRWDGIDITDDVKYDMTKFIGSVSGRPGEMELVVVDRDHIYDFTAGKTVTVDIGGRRVWAGWALVVTATYAFMVDDTSSPGAEDTTRWWILTGPDVNLLFAKRVVYDKDNPANGKLKQWDPETADGDIIRYVIRNYTDLEADGVTLNLSEVGTPVPDKRGPGGAVASRTVGEFMYYVSQLSGAVAYIDPTMVLHYEDDDTEDAPFRLSDRPDGRSNYAGVADFRMLMNGSQLINDALVWGAGEGKNTMTFSREQNAASITEHGRWQEGDLRYDMYKQATVNRTADSYVLGSPQNLRGHKDDQPIYRARVFRDGLTAGMKVRVESEVFGVNEVIPIRIMTIIFPTPYNPVYELEMSHELDAIWSMAEWPPLPRYPGGPGPGGDGLPPDPPKPPVEEPGGCDEEACGITDSFERTTAEGVVGTSDSGDSWTTDTDNGGSVYVDGSALRLHTPAAPTAMTSHTQANLTLPGSDANFRILFSLTVEAADYATVTTTPYWGMGLSSYENSFTEFSLEFGGSIDSSTGSKAILISDGEQVEPRLPMVLDLGTQYLVRFEQDVGIECRVKIWESAEAEPSAWTMVLDSTDTPWSSTTLLYTYINGGSTSGHGEHTILINGIDIDGVNRCGVAQFENFDIPSYPGLGIATYGTPWVIQFVAGNFGVEDGNAYFNAGAVTGHYNYAGTPWAGDFVMTARVRCDDVTLTGAQNTVIGLRIEDSSGLGTGYMALEFWANPGYDRRAYWNIDGDTDSLFVTHDWTTTGWYLIKYDTTQGVKFWLEGTTEPDWTVLPTLTAFPRDRLYLSTNNGSDFSTLHIDYIEFDYGASRPCYGCDNQFDDFDREGSNSWGGFWEQSSNSPLGGATRQVSVVDGFGVITIAPGSGGHTVLMTAHDPNTPWLEPGYTTTIVFKTGPTIPTSGFQTLDIGDDGFVGISARIISGTGGGISGFNGGAFAKTDWVADTFYILEYEYDATLATVTGRVYQVGATIPAWQFTEDVAGTPAGDFTVAYGLTPGQGTLSLTIDYIDFDYPDKPCQTVVVCTPYEDWVSGGDWNFELGTIEDVTFAGNQLILAGESPTSIMYSKQINSNNSVFPDVAQPLTFTIPFSMTGPDADQNSFVEVAFSVTWAGGPNGGGSCTVTVSMNYDVFDEVFYSNISLDYPISTGTGSVGDSVAGRHLEQGVLTISVGPEGYSASAGPVAVSTPAQYTAGAITTHPGMATAYVKFWPHLRNRSGYNAGANPIFETLTMGTIDIQGGWSTTSWCESTNMPPTYPTGGGTTEIPPGPNSFGCEIASRIDSTHYGVSYVIAPATAQVSVNGLTYGSGVDYTTSGTTITFTNTVASGAVVYVCYRGA